MSDFKEVYFAAIINIKAITVKIKSAIITQLSVISFLESSPITHSKLPNVIIIYVNEILNAVFILILFIYTIVSVVMKIMTELRHTLKSGYADNNNPTIILRVNSIAPI